MTSRPGRLALMPASFLALAAALGVTAAIQPLIAIAIVAAGVLAYVVFTDLAVGFGVLLFLGFVAVLPTSGTLTPVKGAGLLVATGWIARYLSDGRSVRDFFAQHSYLAWVMIAFVGWGAVTLLWATDTNAGLTAISQNILDLLLLPIAYTAIRGRRDLMVVLTAIVLGAIVAAGVGIVQPPNPAVVESTRAVGTIGDPNEFAAAALVGLALGAGFAVSRGAPSTLRLMGACAIPICALGMFLSVSRGGLVSLSVLFVVATFTAGRWRVGVTLLLVAVAVGGVLYFTQLAPLPARERVLTANGGSGRSELWTVGLRMWRAHPVGGVGVGNFPASSRNYVLQPGLFRHTYLIFAPTPFPAHNAYLQTAAETGVGGLLMLLAIIAACLRSALRAARIAAARRDIVLEALARSVFLALVGILTAEFFISDLHSKLLWGLLALGPALLAIARESEPGHGAALALDAPVR
jgi:O-antigen ligase